MRLLLRLEYEQKSCPILDDYLFPAPLSSKYPCHLKLSLAKFVQHASNLNQDGWGLANMDGNDAYIYRESVSAQESFLARFLAQEGVNGNTILSQKTNRKSN